MKVGLEIVEKVEKVRPVGIFFALSATTSICFAI